MTKLVVEKTSGKTSTALSGHWRNKFWSQDGWADCDPEVIHLDKNTCILTDRYEREADAEHEGRDVIRGAAVPGNRWHDPSNVVMYLGPVFFPAPAHEGE